MTWGSRRWGLPDLAAWGTLLRPESLAELLKFWENSAFLASKAHFAGCGAPLGDGGSLAGSMVAWGGMLYSIRQAHSCLEIGRTEGPASVSPMEKAPGTWQLPTLHAGAAVAARSH